MGKWSSKSRARWQIEAKRRARRDRAQATRSNRLTPTSTHGEYFGGIFVFRPRDDAEYRLRVEAESHMREEFPPGIYEDRESIRGILMNQSQYFTGIVNRNLGSVARDEFISFLLGQYDCVSRINLARKHEWLSAEEALRWDDIGPAFERALKHLIERSCCLDQPTKRLRAGCQRTLADELLIAAEQLVSINSQLCHEEALVPDGTRLEVLRSGKQLFWRMLSPQVATDFREQVDRDRRNRSKVLQSSEVFRDVSWVNARIGRALKRRFGFDMEDFWALVDAMIKDLACKPGSPRVFLETERRVVDMLCRVNGTPRHAIETMIAGFALTIENMKQEGHMIWKPKREYRAHRRGLFRVRRGSATFLGSSVGMLLDSRECLVSAIGFQKLPREWMDSDVNGPHAKLSNDVGDWFERLAIAVMGREGIVGKANLSVGLGKRLDFARIDGTVGELDFLGYYGSSDLIVLAECKCVQSSSEPRLFQDDLQRFVRDPKSHAVKFRRKIAWLESNFSDVVGALKSEGLVPSTAQPSAFAPVMITYYPNIAESFIPDFPVKSLTNLVLDLREAGGWPYQGHIRRGLQPEPRT